MDGPVGPLSERTDESLLSPTRRQSPSARAASEIDHMAEMEQVEAPIGRDHATARRLLPFAPGAQIFECHDLLPKGHGGDTERDRLGLTTAKSAGEWGDP